MNQGQSSLTAAVIIVLTLAGILGGIGIFSISSNPPSSPTPSSSSSPSPSSSSSSSSLPSPSPSSSSSSSPSPSPSPSPKIKYENSFSDVENVPQGRFDYGGSTTFAPLRSQEIVAAIKNAHPQFKLQYKEPKGGKKPGSGTGIEMLIEDELSFSQSSRSVKDKEFKKAENRGFKIRQIPVAIDGIAFYINPKLMNQGVEGITLEQSKKIFTGEITNWQDLGGPDMEIIPFSRNLKAGGTVDFFYEKVLEKQPLSENVREVRDTTDSIRKVDQTIGGIGYATASEVINQETIRPIPLAKDENSDLISPCADDTCKSVNQNNFADDSYPLTRRLFIVVKEDDLNKLDQDAGIAYVNMILSDEGQNFVEEAGFVAVRK